MKNEVSGNLASRSRVYSWPIAALALLAIQALFAAAVKPGLGLRVYSDIVDAGYLLLLTLATGVAALNAVRSRNAIRLFWFFFASSCAAWALSAWSWIYYVELSGRTPPDFVAVSSPLFFHSALMIAAVASRPHLASSRHRPYKTTLDFLVLLFFLIFLYVFFLFPYEYVSHQVIQTRFAALYFAENTLLIITLGTMFSRVETPWKSIYGHMLGASASYALSSLLESYFLISGSYSAGFHDVPYTISTCWVVWICLLGRRRALELAQTVQVDTVNPKYASRLAMLAVVAIPIFGMWELFRTDQPQSIRVIRLLIVFLALLFLAITALVTEYFSKRELSSDAELANERLRMAMAYGKSVGWEWDVGSRTDRWFGDLRAMFGIDADTFSGGMEDFYQYVHPDDRQRVSDAVADARVNRKPYESEFRIVRQDQSVRWVSARGSFHYTKDGHPERMLGMAVDITGRKHAEDALRSSEEKFSKAFRQSPMALTLTSAKDHRYLDVNETFQQITGWQRDEVIGRTPFDLQIWVDPVERLGLVKRLQTEGSVRNLEIRFRCKDGTERLGLGSVELIEIANELCLLSVIADITDRKLAEGALASVGRRLIEAHEEERTWIARELHDDINQRLALLAIELEKWNHDLPEGASHLRILFQHARKRLFDISKDVQSLSHRLHSSKLEYLGITAAARSYCKELSEQHKVGIDFSHSDIPHSLSTEASLTLFRVLQEALQNGVKHSGAREFRAELRGTPDEVHLTVTDTGIGFDQREGLSSRGLGLISMRERLQLVNGSLAIESKPGHGTIIRARVPINSNLDRLGLAG